MKQKSARAHYLRGRTWRVSGVRARVGDTWCIYDGCDNKVSDRCGLARLGWNYCAGHCRAMFGLGACWLHRAFDPAYYDRVTNPSIPITLGHGAAATDSDVDMDGVEEIEEEECEILLVSQCVAY